MAFGGGAQVFIMKVETGPQGVFAEPAGSHITFGANHGFEHAAIWGFGQLVICPRIRLSGNPLLAGKRLTSAAPASTTTGALASTLSSWHACHWSSNFVQLQHVMVSQHLNIAVQSLEPAQRRRVDPAPFGVEQSTMGQLDPGQRLGLRLIKQMHQCRRKGLCQLRLTLGFLGAKAQLQYATVVPVTPRAAGFPASDGCSRSH